jgi:hypothetical protein
VNDKKRLLTSSANLERSRTVADGTCAFPNNLVRGRAWRARAGPLARVWALAVGQQLGLQAAREHRSPFPLHATRSPSPPPTSPAPPHCLQFGCDETSAALTGGVKFIR